MCLLILVEICYEMTILQQVKIVIFLPYFRLIATRTAWLLHKYKAHIKGFPICFREVQVKNNFTDTKFITL